MGTIKKGISMTRYFLNRLIRRKLLWLALAAGCAVSVYYFISEVWGYDLYEQTVYTMWIESFTQSDIPFLLYTIVPITAAAAAADIYLNDRETGYLNVIFSKIDQRKYFRHLYIINFIVGGLTLLIPLALNLYLCYLVCPDRAPDLLVEGNNIVNPIGNQVLFPQLYYEQPLLHATVYLLLGFIAAGIFATIGLALGCFVKHRFLVWIGPYVINYLFSSLSVAVFGASRYNLVNIYAMHWAVDGVTVVKAVAVMGAWLLAAAALYWIGVRKNARACV